MGRYLKGLVQLTDYFEPEERFFSQYGWVTWAEYLEKEKNRIASSAGRRVEVRKGQKKCHSGKLALFVNDMGINQMIERQSCRKMKSASTI